MFSNENDFSIFFGHQRIGEAKNMCNFLNILGRMAEKKSDQKAGKSDQIRLFYGTK